MIENNEVINFEEELEFLLKTHRQAASRPLNRELPPEQLMMEMDISIRDEAYSRKEIRQFLEDYLKYSVNTQHPYYVNQLWSRTEDASLVGEMMSSLTNTSMYTYEVAPVATLLEIKMSEYLGGLVWPKPSEGIMTSGGTASNLQALLTARNSKFPQCKDGGVAALDKKLTVFCASNSHYSVKRAANILGLGQSQLIEVEVNQKGQMTKEKLQLAIEGSLQRGEQPFCVVSTAGTTVAGAYDDCGAIGELCKEHGLWFHIDGAYGGSALLSQKHRRLLKGAEKADSFSWDFHKILGIHLPCAFLFTREKEMLKRSLVSGNDSYLFHDEESIDLGPSSLQCGRRNDILKLWMTFMSIGLEGLAHRVDKLFAIAQSLAEKVNNDPDFELVMDPLSINVCFRYKKSANTAYIRDKLRLTAQLMINYSSDSDGDFFRFASTNPSLSDADLDKILDLIKTTGRES